MQQLLVFVSVLVTFFKLQTLNYNNSCVFSFSSLDLQTHFILCCAAQPRCVSQYGPIYCCISMYRSFLMN